jgi:hypothetical protein
MTKAQLRRTEWAHNFKRECPGQYETALEFASSKKLTVKVAFSNETGDPLYAIDVVNYTDNPDCDCFWLDAFPTEREALELCDKMGWKIVDN